MKYCDVYGIWINLHGIRKIQEDDTCTIIIIILYNYIYIIITIILIGIEYQCYTSWITLKQWKIITIF